MDTRRDRSRDGSLARVSHAIIQASRGGASVSVSPAAAVGARTGSGATSRRPRHAGPRSWVLESRPFHLGVPAGIRANSFRFSTVHRSLKISIATGRVRGVYWRYALKLSGKGMP